jgi:hypothetical protein
VCVSRSSPIFERRLQRHRHRQQCSVECLLFNSVQSRDSFFFFLTAAYSSIGTPSTLESVIAFMMTEGDSMMSLTKCRFFSSPRCFKVDRRKKYTQNSLLFLWVSFARKDDTSKFQLQPLQFLRGRKLSMHIGTIYILADGRVVHDSGRHYVLR